MSEVVDAFGLGFADRSLGRSMPGAAAGRVLAAADQALP
jgi:hypothetical protein